MIRPQPASLLTQPPQHPRVDRRTAVQAGAIGLLGLGMNHLAALRGFATAGELLAHVDAAAAPNLADASSAKRVIYIFLSGGLAQHESFDLKPDAPEEIRGEFKPIATRTPGVQICEHLPRLAALSHHWALVRSLTHPYNEHSQGHMVMLSGRTPMPVGFDANGPKPGDWPSMAAIAGAKMPAATTCPPPWCCPSG